jgi:MFS family permease
MIAFPTVGALVQSWGWRPTWFAIGVALVVGLAPVAWLVVRTPAESGSGPRAMAQGPSETFHDGYDWAAAIATPAFWVFAIGAALYGLVASGIGLFNESILAERGFDANVYYQTLVVTALTALAGNFAGGWLATRVRLTSLLAVSQFVLATGLLALPHLATRLHVMLWAAAMGVGGGFVMVLFFSVWARVFGRRHLGRIQGIAQAVTVLASALGPLVLAQCVAATGSYAAMFRILAVVIAGVGAAALVVALPRPIASPVRA